MYIRLTLTKSHTLKLAKQNSDIRKNLLVVSLFLREIKLINCSYSNQFNLEGLKGV